MFTGRRASRGVRSPSAEPHYCHSKGTRLHM